MELYWVSVIIQNGYNTRPWLCTMNEGETSLDKAMETVGRLKESHTILSAWIDVFDENNIKQTVFHECYIDYLGHISYE